MKDIVKLYLKSIISTVVCVAFGIIMLGNIMAITLLYIDYADGRLEIQKRDVTIEALIVSCKQDHLIKIRRGE